MLTLPNDTSAAFTCDISASPSWGFIPNFDFSMVVDLEGGNIKLNQYLVAHLYHAITVTKSTGERRVERGFRFPEDGQLEPGPSRGEDWWTTYRHQLEAFVDKVKGREPRTWYSKADSVAEAEWLHKIYETVGPGCFLQTNGTHLYFLDLRWASRSGHLPAIIRRTCEGCVGHFPLQNNAR